MAESEQVTQTMVAISLVVKAAEHSLGRVAQ
jgi:hypothetical protein